MVIEEVNLGIKQSKKFHQMLNHEMDEYDEVIIDFSKVKRIDLSIVQVITAAGRDARKRGKVIMLKSASDDVKRQLKICGLKA